MSTTLVQLLQLLIPVIVAIVTVPLFDLITDKLLPVFNGLPAPVKQALVPVLVAVLTYLTSLTGAQFPTTVVGITPAAVSAVLSTLLAYLLKLAQQVKTVKNTQDAVAQVQRMITASNSKASP